jgi:hypothetical protein
LDDARTTGSIGMSGLTRRRAADTRARWRSRAARLDPWQVDAGLLTAIVLVVVLVDWAFASRSFFFGDDYVVFWQSRTHSLDLDYLTSAATAHFAPAHRLITYLFERIVPGSYDAALALVLAFLAAAVVLMQRTLALLFGRVWWTYGLALVFGLSTIYVSAVWWFSPALLILPALAFSIAVFTPICGGGRQLRERGWSGRLWPFVSASCSTRRRSWSPSSCSSCASSSSTSAHPLREPSARRSASGGSGSSTSFPLRSTSPW